MCFIIAINCYKKLYTFCAQCFDRIRWTIDKNVTRSMFSCRMKTCGALDKWHLWLPRHYLPYKNPGKMNEIVFLIKNKIHLKAQQLAVLENDFSCFLSLPIPIFILTPAEGGCSFSCYQDCDHWLYFPGDW